VDAKEDILDYVGSALIDGEEAASTIVSGGEPDLEKLERWAEAMEVFRVELANRRIYAGWLRPTEEDVSAARHLVQLVRDGVPREALVEPARRVFRVTADPQALTALRSVLPWLAGGSGALTEGAEVAKGIATGTGEPDLQKLERWAEDMEVFRGEITRMAGGGALLRPTEEDVSAARHLVQLVRDGVPPDALIEAAWRVFDMAGDADSLKRRGATYARLGDEKTAHIFFSVARQPGEVRAFLDSAIDLFERGGNVAGFVPTPDDLSRVRRLRELAMADSGEELAERRRLAKELWARLPQDYAFVGAQQRLAGDA